MRRFIFLCQGTYHLLVSSSFSRQIQDSSAEKILVFDESTEYKINPEKVCPYFDRYIRIPGKAREGSGLERQWFKLVYEGYFFL